MNYPKVASFASAAEFRRHLHEIGARIDLDDAAARTQFQKKLVWRDRIIGNRWCILPMEGWDCELDGSPGELTRRRWLRFAASGAKLLFGGEACAVMESGRSNPHQLMITDANHAALGTLLTDVRNAHRAQFGTSDDLLVGLQLTHSGRFSHPHDDAISEPVTAYANPWLDKKFHCNASHIASDAALRDIEAHFVHAAELAQQAGFDFVDVKMAHGYLGFELLGALDRPGPYGGSFANRSRFFREIVEGIHRAAPRLKVATRLSLFDFIPYVKNADGIGEPMTGEPYAYAFGGDGTGRGIDLTETGLFLELCREIGVDMICTSAGSPYYNPHIQRPAYYPVSDGYLPPEEPLLGAARQICAVAEVKKRFPDLIFIGSGYTVLQEYAAQVGGWVLANQGADAIGIGRMALAYPELCADVLAGRQPDSRRLCRTFGDCTTAPRNRLVSGCYPLDEFYRNSAAAQTLKRCKHDCKFGKH